MAEAHPVGFQWVMEAKARGAKVIHVDPRFTRTSALADTYVPLRAGTDIVLLGGVINHVLQNELDFRDYVVAYTNAATILSDDYADTEDLDGLFSGLRPRDPHLRPDQLAVRRPGAGRATDRQDHADAAGDRERAAARDPRPERRPGTRRGTRRCSTPTASTRCSSGTTPATPPRWSSRPAASRRRRSSSSARRGRPTRGRDRTTALVYSVGWTQHSVGVQYIRTGAILQLLLGNMGRPGGGIMALRGHASIQGSTDIPTLFNLLPGYLPMPNAQDHQTPGGVGGQRPSPRVQGLLGPGRRLRRQHAQGLVGRGRHAGQRLLLRLPAPDHRRPRHLPHGAGHDRRQGQGLLPARAEPRRRLRQRARPATRYGEPRLARRARPVRDRERDLLEERARDRDRGDRDRGVPHRGVPAPRGLPRGEGGHLHPDPAGAAVAGEGRRAGRRLPLRAVVLLPPGPDDPGAPGRLHPWSATVRCWTWPGTTPSTARPPTPAPRRC